MALNKQDRIKTVMDGGKHVVILGAGASIAATLRDPIPTGKILPSMDNFIETVNLHDIVSRVPNHLQTQNFESFYSQLHKINPNSKEIMEIEKRVRDYFEDMQLPETPTLYDYLVLSLRPKDLIATFNWDPLLYQAYVRNKPKANLPHLSFLHGNVAIGYSSKDKVCGPSGMFIKSTKNYLEPTKLLYPIHKKNYNLDEFIHTEWKRLKYWLNSDNTKRVTIFGYGAPQSDAEAIKLLHKAWGNPQIRDLEQFEIIDIRSEKVVRKQWNDFIHSHHYDYVSDYFSSSLAENPRRTCESYFQHIEPLTIEEAFSESNPIPKDLKTMEELWQWHKDLINAEEDGQTR